MAADNAPAVVGPHLVLVGGKAVGRVVDPRAVPPSLAQAIIDVVVPPATAGDGCAASAATGEASASGGQGGPPSAAGSGPVTYAVTVRLPETLVTVSVPSSAVMVDESGQRTCVWTARQDGSGYDAVTVTVLEGQLGSTSIDGPVEGRKVLVNPADTLSRASCPST